MMVLIDCIGFPEISDMKDIKPSPPVPPSSKFKNSLTLYLGRIDDQNRTLINFNDKKTTLNANDCHSRRSKIININERY